jgi:transposase/5S rRNA maturation endonuclease (ribonuclease M5)
MNILKPEKRNAIDILSNNGASQREIHRKIKIDRKTIRKYRNPSNSQTEEDSDSKSSTLATGSDGKIDQNPPPRPPARDDDKIPKQARSACDSHREWIEAQVRLGRNATAIYQDLVEQHGFTHKYNSVKRFVRGLKKKDPKQFDRLEFPPGEEAQVDYGTGAKTLHESGKYRKPRLFIMTLKYSGRAFRKVVWNSSQEIWARLHEEAFRYFGGCPQYVVLDNLKEGVLKPDIYEPELNVVYEAMLNHYGVIADPARVRDPDRKGTVENAIKHTQTTALKGRQFEVIEQQNEWLMHWEEKWAAPRIHGRAKRQVEEMFQEEKPFLKELPLTPFRYFKQETRTVWDDGTIQVEKCYYAALPAPLHEEVMVRIYDREIEIIDPKTLLLIRRHIKGSRPGAVEMEEEDRIFNPSRQTAYLLSKAGKIGPATRELCERLFEEEGRCGQRRMQGVVNLARRFEARHIEEAATMAVKTQLRTCKAIRKLVETIAEKADKKKEDESALIQNHALIRMPSDYGEFWQRHAAGADAEQNSDQAEKQSAEKMDNVHFSISKEQLRQVWQNADWRRVIEVFGLQEDSRGRCGPDEIWIKSPFTAEKTASLHLNVRENIFKDFSSGKGASAGILNFCQDMLQRQGQTMNCYEVASWMLENHISTITRTEAGSAPEDELGSRKQPIKPLTRNPAIKVDLRPHLRTDHTVMEQRQVSPTACRYLGCGFLPQRTNGSALSPLNGRMVFQIRGVENDHCGFKVIILSHAGRALTSEQEHQHGKYWSFPFRKGLEIYNQDNLLLDLRAHQQIRQYGLILLEGFFDVAALIGGGCLNVGALMGAQITAQQVARLKEISAAVEISKIMIFLDRDEAGSIGTRKSRSLLQENGFEVETFDWNQHFKRSDGMSVSIPDSIRDAGDMSSKQIQWLRQQNRI